VYNNTHGQQLAACPKTLWVWPKVNVDEFFQPNFHTSLECR
jgi:hypothetical protein